MSLQGSPSRREQKRGDLPQSAEINVTSLIDVAFTLLVIFIITAPVLQGGLEVDLPEGDVDPITQQDDPFFVSVDADGGIYIAETPIPQDEFRERLREFVEVSQPAYIYVRGDAQARHGAVAWVEAAVHQTARDMGIGWRKVMEEEWDP